MDGERKTRQRPVMHRRKRSSAAVQKIGGGELARPLDAFRLKFGIVPEGIPRTVSLRPRVRGGRAPRKKRTGTNFASAAKFKPVPFLRSGAAGGRRAKKGQARISLVR